MKAAIIDAAPDPVVAIDEHLRILQLNAAAERAFGYSASEAIGSDLIGLIAPPDLRERSRRQLRSRLATDPGDAPTPPVELVAIRRDGSTLPVEVTVAPVPATDPGVFAGYIRDVTGQRRTEERALKQSRACASGSRRCSMTMRSSVCSLRARTSSRPQGPRE